VVEAHAVADKLLGSDVGHGVDAHVAESDRQHGVHVEHSAWLADLVGGVGHDEASDAHVGAQQVELLAAQVVDAGDAILRKNVS